MLRVIYRKCGLCCCCCCFISGDSTAQHAKHKENFMVFFFSSYLSIYFEIRTTPRLDCSRSCRWSPLLSQGFINSRLAQDADKTSAPPPRGKSGRARRCLLCDSAAACCYFHPLIISLTSLNLNPNRVRNVAWAPSSSTRCVINDSRITTVH